MKADQLNNYNFIFVYVTAPSVQIATDISKTLIQEHLVACANILPPMKSFYQWKGNLQEEEETAMIFKTQASCYSQLELKIREIHPYECPCIVAIPIIAGDVQFLNWVKEQTT